MALVHTFTTPIAVGQYPNQITVASVRLASISFNFEKAKSSAATPVCACSIVLEDPVTGYKFANPMFQDAAALTIVQSLLAATAAGQTIEAAIMALALTATDAATGKALVPAGVTT